VGDAALVDSARPVTYVSENGYRQWFSLQLPRRSPVFHLGFELQYGFCGRCETRAGRHAARLLQRRALLNTSQPIGEVARDSGFNDSTHFARKFRRRFGRPLGAPPEI
jgi:hypothetical protein